MNHENIDHIALMEKVNAADGLPDPSSFTTEEWLYLQEMGIAAGLEESIGLAEEELVHAERKAARTAGEYTHEYKMERAKKAGEGWMGRLFVYAILIGVGYGVMSLLSAIF